MRISDLSSDVCSSDLEVGPRPREEIKPVVRVLRERSGELVRAVPERAFGSRAEARPVRPGRVAEGSEQQPVDAFDLRPGQEPRLNLPDEAHDRKSAVERKHGGVAVNWWGWSVQ